MVTLHLVFSLGRYGLLHLSRTKFLRPVHRGLVHWLDIDHIDSRYLLSCSSDASLAIFDTFHTNSNGDEKSTTIIDSIASIRKQSPGAHRASVSTVCWYPVDNGIFLSGAKDGLVKIWDSNTLTVASHFDIGSPVHAAAMSPLAGAHALVAVGSSEPDAVLCDMVSGGCVHRLIGHRGPILSLAWSLHSENEVLTGGADGQVRVWDVRRAGTLAVLDMHRTAKGAPVVPSSQHAKSHEGGVISVIPTPDGLYWASLGDDGSLRLWDAVNYRHLLVNYAYEGGIYDRRRDVRFKPRRLAVSDDGTTLFVPLGLSVHSMDVASGKQVAHLYSGHYDSVYACAWNSYTSELYSSSADQAIVVWEPKAPLSGGGEFPDRDAWSD